jgi:hypothetical protein
MSERGPELSPADMGKIETKFTVGKVEKPVEQKIEETANKIIESGIFKEDKFATEQDRNNKANEIIEVVSGGGFSSYENLINATCDENRPEAQKNGRETFDILKKSISIAMNLGGDQELQNRLYSGGVSEILPNSWKYNNMDNSDLDLAGGVLEVTITDKNILDMVRKLDKVKSRVDLSKENEREYLAGKVEDTVISLLDMEVSDDKENELITVKSYLNNEAGILKGELKTNDGSANKADVTAVLGQAAEKISAAAEKMVNVTMANMTMGKNKERKIDTNKVNRSRSGSELKYKTEEFPDLSETSEPLLKTPEGEVYSKEQLEYIEERLNIIENYPTSSIKRELALGDFTYPLFAMLAERSAPEHILNIINTRLTLKEVGNKLAANSGSMGERGDGLIRCISELESEGFDMSPEVMSYFFEDKIDGLKTAEAWDLMESANFDYSGMLKQISQSKDVGIKSMVMAFETAFGNGAFIECKQLKLSVGTPLEGKTYNYYLETQGKKQRVKIVKEYMIKELMTRNNIGEKQARKSMQLAEFMYDATMESGVVDWDFLNGDEYAELVNTAYIRKLDGAEGSKGKLVGPYASRKHIKHLTPGWVRSFCDERDPTKPIMSKTIVEKGLKGGAEHGGLIAKELYSAHFISIISKKVYPAKRLILNEDTPLQKDILKTQYFKGVNDFFNKVDSQSGKGTEGIAKTVWLAGLIELTFTSHDSTWTKQDYRELERIVTSDSIYSDEKGKSQAFITKKQWDWITKNIDYGKEIGRRNRADLQALLLSGKKKH